MSSIIIFWAAIMAITFFLLGIFFKAMAAVFNSLFSSAEAVVSIIFFIIIALLGLFILCAIIDAIVTGNILNAILFIVVAVIALTIIFVLVGWLGVILLDIAIIIAQLVLTVVSFILEFGAGACESAYVFFLRIIVKRVEKC